MSKSSGRARVVLVAGMMSAGVLAGVACFGTGVSSAARSIGSPSAVTARTITLNESGHLRRTSHSGLKLNEKGSASGTIKGTIYIHLDVVSPNRVTAEVNIYPHGGSLTGTGSAAYHVDGGVANFSGTLKIDRGSGSYAGAHGSGLSFSGTIQRLSGAVTVRLRGKMST
ncbi:MAG: hypothetical protein ACRDK7_10540 [Solirubrobacteraceae bacterium]